MMSSDCRIHPSRLSAYLAAGLDAAVAFAAAALAAAPRLSLVPGRITPGLLPMTVRLAS